jgi:ketosteroid isomerase-like protein
LIDYAAAGELLAAYGRARESFDGDAWTGLFTDDAEYHNDPFGPPVVGHNGLRAWLLAAAASQRDVEFTVERHWVSGATVLAAWHVAFVGRSREQVRLAGFLVMEVVPDGRINRLREWAVQAPAPAH